MQHDQIDHPTPPAPNDPRAARREAARHERVERLERAQAHRAQRAARGPGAWRTWVLPMLKLAVAAVIGIALVKLAFFPAQETTAAEQMFPGASFAEPLAVVERGSIENAVSIDGTVVPVEAVPVRSTRAGTVARVNVTEGAVVAEGDVLYAVRVETQPLPNAEGVVGPPTSRVFNVTAPASGTLTDFALLPEQSIDIATETGAVQPPQHLVRASLGAAEQYRLAIQPETATVTIADGPAPFECSDVRIAQPEGEEVTTGASATLTCAVPADVRVFVGLAATLVLAAGSADDVLLLPTTAVLGSADAGLAYRPVTSDLISDDATLVDEELDEAGFEEALDGEMTEGGFGESSVAPTHEEVRLELGISDGTMVEVRSGLAEGDEVLQFVPGAADPCADRMTADPMLCGDAP